MTLFLKSQHYKILLFFQIQIIDEFMNLDP